VWAVDRLFGGYAGRRVEVVATMSFTLRHVQAIQWKRACDITMALVWMCSCGASKATSSTSLAAMLGIHASPSWDADRGAGRIRQYYSTAYSKCT
jgi:hypothetical protein